MNHIYKVVWSKTTNSLVVVSELASSQGKAASVVSKGYKLSSVFKKSFQLTALSALLISVMPAAQAAIAVGASTVTNWNGAVSVSLNGASATGASVPYNYHTPNNENYPDQGNNSNSSNIYSGTLSAAQSIAIGINATSQSGSIALGDNSRATGGLSLALGAFSQTNQAGAIALGTSALASGFNSFATMRQAAATADFAIAMGTAANANATNSIAMGSSALALGNQSIAIGSAAMEKKVGSAGGESYRTDYVGTTNTKAQGDRTIAFGVNTSTTSNDSIAIGSNSKTNAGTGAIAIGWCSSTSYQDSVAIGSNATANGGYSLALGYNATSTNLTSISIGWNAAASNTGGGHSQGAVAIGPKTTALGNQSVVLGASASAVEQATAIGNDSKANGFGSIVIGGDDTGYSRNPNSDPYTPTALGGERIGYLANTATGDNSNYRSSLSSGIGSVVVGVHGQALSNGSTAIGVYSTAGDNGITFTNDTTSTTAIEATAIGALSRAKSIRSSAIGYSAEALGNYSTVVGANSTANGTSSLALGHNSTAYSTYSLAAGYNASANLSNSTAIGSSSNASGLNAIALGTGAQALNTNTISIGTGNIVSGENSGAIGDPNNITGSNSYALGNNNVIYANNSFAVGNSIYISDTAQNTLAFGTNISVPTSTKTNNTLIGTSAKIQGGESSIAFGTNATVSNSVQSSAIAIGNQSKVEAAVGGIAIGNGSTISSSANNGSIALGQKTNVTGVSSIALGNNASVTGTQQGSVAIGNNTNVTNTGQGTVAVGSDTNVTVGNAVAIGDHVNVKGQRSIAIGSSSNVAEGVVNATTIGTGSNVTQNDGTAVGYNAIVSNYNGLALGANATSTAQRAVALGADSVAGREGWDQAAYDPYIPANANTSQSAAITATKATNNYGAVSVGSDTVKRQIINVAAGSADSDAVNVAQLKAAIGSVNTSWNIQENGTQKDIVNAGDNVSFANGTGTTANVSVDSTGKTSTVKYSVNKSGLSVATDGTVTAAANGDNFATAEQVAKAINDSEKTTTVEKGSDKVSVTGTTTGTKTNYVVDLSNAAKSSLDKADSALQSWTAQVNGANAKVVNQTNNTVNFVNGTNTIVKADANGNISVSTTDNVTFNTVNASSFNAGNISIGTNGINAGNTTITNVANGTNASDAVNVSQLNATNANVTNNTQNITNNTAAIANNTANISNNTNAIANNTQNITKNAADIQSTKDGLNATNATVAGNTANITNNTNAIANNTAAINKGINFGNGTTANNFALGSTINVTSDSNIEVSTVADGVKLALASSIAVDNLTANNSVKVGNVALTQAGINAGNHAITNVTNGTNATDAVNLSQLNASKSSVEAGDNVAVTSTSDANGTVYTVNANTSTVSNGSDKVTVTSSSTGNHTTNYAVDLSEAAKSSLNKADSALQSWTAQVNGVDAKVVNQTNNTVNFVNGTNTIVKADANGNISVSTADNVTFNTVNASTFNAGNVSISNNGINAGNTTITNVANGTNASDAVNLSQLNATNANVTNNTKNITNVTNLVNQGFNIGADNGADDNVKLGEKVDFNGDGNIVTTVTNNAIAFALSNTLNLTDAGSVTMGDTVVNSTGMLINNGSTDNQTVSLTKDGLNNGGNTITGVANGSNATDAVNLSQLNAGKSSVEAGDNVAVTSTSDANGTVYTVNANTSTVSNGSDKVTVTSSSTGNHTTNYALDLSEAAKASLDKADSALQSLTTSADGTKAQTLDKDNSNANFISGSNIRLTPSADGITIATAENVTFTNVNTTNFKAGDVTINSTGIDAGNHTITNVAKGVNATDAVNLSQLESYVGDNSYNWNLSDGTNSSAVADNSTVAITGSANADSANISGIVTELNGTNVSVDLSNKTKADIQQGVDANTTVNTKGITFAADSGTATERKLGETLAINGDGDLINTTVSAGKVEVAASDKLKDAVNNATTALQSWTAQVNGADAKVVNQTNNTVNFVDGSNINITNDNGTIKVATADNVSFNSVNTTEFKAGDVTINSTGINAGNHTITNVANGTQDSDAVNLSQLNATNANVTNNTNNIANNTANITNNMNAIASNTATINKGINFGNGTTANNFALGSTINVTSDSNIEVSTVADGVKLALASSIAVNNVTVNDTFKAGDVTINSTGIDAGNHTITNVVKGVNATDAVNLSQLNASKSSVEAGDNVAVTSTSDANGTVYTVNANTSTVSNGSNKITVTQTDAGNHTSNYAVDLSDAAKASLDKADSALQSWTAQVNGTNAKVVNQTNDTVNFVNGTNTIVKADANGNISVSTTDNVTFNTVNASSFNAGNISIGTNGINAGNTTITNVANGTNASDAVNVSQLNATNANVTNNTQNITKNAADIQSTKDGLNATNATVAGNTANITNNTNAIANNTAAINKGINFGNGTTDNNFALGDTINVTSDSNIVVNTEDDGVKLSLADNVTVNNTFKAGDVTINNNGIDAGNHAITNVAKGVNATDAVNLSQLNASKSSVEAGDNVAVTSTSDANGTVYTVNANTSTVSNGSDKITVTQTDAGNHTSNYAVDLSDAAKASLDKADSALQSLTTSADGTKAQTLDKDNSNANFISGSNIRLTPSADGITIATAENVTFTNVNTTNFKAGDVTINSTGIDAGNHTITNVAKGVNATDAVNLSQLESYVGDNSYNWNLSDGTNSSAVADNSTVAITGSANADSANISGIVTELNGTNVSVDLSNKTKADIQQGVDANTTVNTKGITFAADSGTATERKLGETLAINGDGDLINTTVSAGKVEVAASDKLKDAVNNATTALQSWMAQVNGADAKVVNQTNNTVNFVNGTNTIVKADANGNISVSTADNVTFNTVNASSFNAGNISIGTNGINAGNTTITNVANGTNASDAVNVSQLNATNANVMNNTQNITSVTNLVNQGFNIGADNGTDDNVKLSEKVDFNGDGNIVTTVTNNAIAFALSHTLNLTDTGSVTIGDTVVNSTGMIINNGSTDNQTVSLTKDGLNNGGNTITGVANGSNATDAVNLSQLNAGKSSVEAGDNVAVTSTSDANGTVYTVNANTSTVSNGSDKVTVTSSSTGNHTTNYALDLSEAAKASLDKADSALQSLTTSADGAKAQTLDKDNSNANFISGSNIRLTPSADGITIATAENVTFTNVNTTNFKAGDVTINSTGIDAGNHTITNVAKGVNATDAVNLSQLESYVGDNSYNWNLSDGTNSSAVADNSTVAITGSANGDGANTSGIVTELNGTNVSVDLSDKAKESLDKADSALQSWTAQVNGTDAKVVNQTNNTVNFVDGSNINITNDNGTIKVATADNVTFNTVNASTFNAGNVSISNSGINAGNHTITNVSNGTKDSDAVNLSQLNATNANVTNNTNNIANNTQNITSNTNAINKGINFGNGTTANNFALGSTINVTSDSNIVVNTTNAGVQLGLADNIAVDNVTVNNTFKAGDVTINNNGIDAGNHAITNVTNGTNATDAVNVSQLNASKSSVEAGDNVAVTSTSDANGTVYTVNANTSTVSNGSDKVTVTSSSTGNHTTNYALDLSDAAKASLDKADSALQSLTTSADGAKAQTLDKDNSNANFISGSNIRLTPSADGITIATAENVTFTNVNTTNFKAGDVTINSTGIDAGNHTITNVAAGTNKTDAVNLGQLEQFIGDNSYNWNLSDGTNSSAVADNSTVAIEGSANGDSANTSGIVTMLDGTNVSVDLSDKAKVSLDKADSALQSWTAQVNGADAKVVNQTNNTVNFVNGTNTIVKADANGNISVSTADNVTFNTVNASTFNAGNVSISNNGINAGNTTITNVANGTNASDAVNVSQLNATNANVTNNTNNIANNTQNITNVTNLVNQGFNIGADNGADDNVKLGEKVDFNGDSNIVTTVTNNAIAFALSHTLNLTDAGSVTMGDTVVNSTGMIINNGSTDNQTVSLTKDGLNNGGNTITGVANGSNATDAVNLSQLNAGKSSVEAGDNVAVTSTSDANGTVYTVNANTSTVSNGSNKITVTQTDAGNHTSNYAVDLSDAAKASLDKADNALQSWTAQVNGADAKVVNQTNNTVNFVNGTNTIVKADANGNISVSTADNVTFNTVNASTFNAGDVSFNTSGINAGNHTITNVANGSNASDAVNVAQLEANTTRYYSVNSTVAGNRNNDGATGINAMAAGANAVASGDNATAIGQGTKANSAAAIAIGNNANATSSRNDSVIAIGNNAQSTGSYSIAVGTNSVANHTWSMAMGISAKAIDDYATALGSSAQATSQWTTALGAGANATGSAATAVGSNTTATAGGATVVGYNSSVTGANTTALGNNINVDTEGSVVLGNGSAAASATTETTATVNNLTYSGFAGADNVATGDYVSVGSVGEERQIKNVAAGNVSATSTDAINGSQLYATQNVIGNVANSVVNNFGGNATVDQNGNITFTDIGGTGANTIHDAIQNVSNVAKMGWNVQANGDTATKVAPGDTVQFINGQNIEIDRDGTNITVATANNVTFTNVNTTTLTAGPVTINSRGIDAGNHTITNVAKGVNATDAVNLAQLESYVGDNSYNWNLSDGNNSSAVADNSTVAITGSANGDSANTSGIVTELNGTNVSVDLSNKTKADIQQGVDANTTVNTKGITFAADSGTATERKLGETLAINGDGDLINTTVSAGKVEVAASDKLKDAVNNATTALQSWTAQVNGTDAKVVDQTNNTVNFVNGNNINITNNNGTIKVATTDNVTFNTVNASTFNAGGVSISNSGINAGNTTITNVANGTQDSDAVNLSQLNATNANVTNNTNNIANNTKNITNVTNLVNQGFNIGADNGTDDNVKLGEKVDFNGDGNIVTTVTNNAIAFALSNTLNLTDAGSVTMGDTVVNGSGMIINNGSADNQTVSLTKDGLNNGGNTITNVAIGSNATDAVNLSQLNASKSSVEAGDNVAVTSTSDANGTVYTVNANSSTVSNGSDKITVTQTDAGNHTSNYAVDLSEAAKSSLNKADSALQSWTAQVNGTDAKVVNQTNNTVNFVNGTNTIVKADANGNISVSTADNVTFNTVNASTFNAGGVSISNSGINAGNTTITNVANGTQDSDAVNLSQLNATNANVTNNTQNITNNTAAIANNTANISNNTNAIANNTQNITKNAADIQSTKDGLNATNATVAGNTANITNNTNAIANNTATINKGINFGNGTTANNFALGSTINVTSDSNIEVSTVADGVKLALASSIAVDNLTANNSVKVGNVALTQAGINAGNHAITNVTNGTNATDAVNVQQLTNAVNNASSGSAWKITENNDATNAKTVGNSTVSFNNGSNTIAVVNGTNVTYNLADNITLTNAGSVTIGNTMVNNDGIKVGNETTISNGSATIGSVTIASTGKISGVAKGTLNAASTEAVNGSQLYETNQNVSNLTAQLSQVNQTANAGWKLAVNGTSTSTVAPNATVSLNNSDNNVVITKDANSSNVTFGLNSTLNIGNGANTVKVDGTNGSISTGNTTITGDNVKTTTLTTGNTTINNDGLVTGNVTVKQDGINAGGNKITGVADGDISANSTDAVNGGQLYNVIQNATAGVKTEVEAGKNIVVTNSTGANGQTVYTVETAKEVDFDKVTVGNVTINKDTNKVSGIANGDISATSSDAINGSQLYTANQNVADHLGGGSKVDENGNVTAPTYTVVTNPSTNATTTANNVGDAINGLNTAISKPLTFAADSGSNSEMRLGSTVSIKGGVSDSTKLSDNNIGVVSDGKGNLTVKLAKDISGLNSVTTGDTTMNSEGITINNGAAGSPVSLTKNGLNNGGNRITNVAPGEVSQDSTDAVNGSQLHATNQQVVRNAQAINQVANHVNKVDRNLRAGIAGAMAAGGLYHATLPGKSMVAAGVGTYRGESAIAVGYSRLSDNGKLGVKFSVNGNTRGDTGAAASVGYQW
ncbi:YadA-like family protein [Basfia succiniciproducens]|uniref:YadA-like family protein n=1 Tax=Basfia succiniciproducens TaxID=653940 RepID=UPI003FCD57D7